MWLAAAAAVVIVVAAAVHVHIAAAAEQQNQDDDPPAVVPTKAAIVTHRCYLRIYRIELHRSFHAIPFPPKCSSLRLTGGLYGEKIYLFPHTVETGRIKAHYRLPASLRSRIPGHCDKVDRCHWCGNLHL